MVHIKACFLERWAKRTCQSPVATGIASSVTQLQLRSLQITRREPNVQSFPYRRALNTSNIGTGPPLVTTEGITPFHFSTAVL